MTRVEEPLDILVAMFQGGGNVHLITPIVRQLVSRGHDVRVLAGPGVRANRLSVTAGFLERVASTGAEVIEVAGPNPHPFDGAPPMRGLVGEWTPRSMSLIPLVARPNLWSGAWASIVSEELERRGADVIVTDYVLLGALAAAEASGIPSVALVHQGFYPWPARGLPPYGAGAMPARGPAGWLRDTLYNAASRRVYVREGLGPLNDARARLKLSPLRSPIEQYDRAARVLILGSAAFDFLARRLPGNVRYVGTPVDDERGAGWHSPWAEDDPRPLVLVSLSTLEQGQGPVLRRVVTALGNLPVRALVTLGPALNPAGFSAPPNVVLETFVPHEAVLPHAAAMVTQCGLSTLMKALSAGVPVVCIPLVADQPDNAARVVALGAGVRLSKDALPDEIGAAIERVLNEPSIREGASTLAASLTRDNGAETVAEEIEAAAEGRAA